jgi:5-methylcytosine-specific restriction protein B
MSTLTPELRAEIAQHLRASIGSGLRQGLILRDIELGLDAEQIAAKQNTSVQNARNYIGGVQAVLDGKLPTTPSNALKGARTYRYLMGCDLSPALCDYVTSCLRQLNAINPEVRVEEPLRPGPPRDAGTHPRLGQKVWIFQANPQLFDLLDFLTEPSTQPGTVDSWLLRKHADEVSDGDTVLLWTAGENAGIYATGTIVGESFMRDRADWEPTEAPPESRAIRYRLEHILLDRPVLRRDLINHPVLKDLSVIRQPQGTNFPVTEQQWEALRPLIESPSGTQATPPPPERFDPSDDLEWLLSETLWSRAEVEDVLDTLRMRRPQIILAGPPGTGKTWVAERIAQYLTGGQLDAVHIVQFHPSYAYEDFVYGLRPVASDGQVAFEVVPGELIKVADHARQVDPHPVVLVIDEMNRANLPSVFGELLYLLEYRDKEIRLLHRDLFSLPPNLYVIGTMNTADRSIRSVDTALRRRFDIFECRPRPEILDAYYNRAGNHSEVSGLAEGLGKLNDTLTQHIDRHHTIGHTFFMEKSLTQNELRRTWLRQIRPLIDEYFFDQPDLVQQFDLTMFWPSLPSL